VTRQLPCAIEPDAAIGLWTPASPGPALFPRRYQRALAALDRPVVTTESTAANNGMGAADPGKVADDLHKLLVDERVGAVLCTTGGYTCSAVLRHIDWDLVREAARPIIGYSDATSMLWSALARADLVSFHGPMLISEWGEWGGPWPYTMAGLSRALSPEPGPRSLPEPEAWTDETLWWDREDTRRRVTQVGPWRCLRPGTAEGWLLPGCAPTAAHLFGTPYLPEVDGALLCLEFTGMGPDEVWAHLNQWADSGLLDRVAGLVIGRFSGPRAAAGGSADYDRVLQIVLGDRDLPVLVDVDFGHTEPMLTLPVGTRARLDTTDRLLTLLEPATIPTTRKIL
jgi:muramoyltetrapeptide carboxypeptidase